MANVPNGPKATGNQVLTGQTLHPGDSIVSPNGHYSLVLQADSNLVLYTVGGKALWASNTVGKRVAVCIMQGDGNLVLYDGDVHAVWASNTSHSPNAHLAVQ